MKIYLLRLKNRFVYIIHFYSFRKKPFSHINYKSRNKKNLKKLYIFMVLIFHMCDFLYLICISFKISNSFSPYCLNHSKKFVIPLS